MEKRRFYYSDKYKNVVANGHSTIRGTGWGRSEYRAAGSQAATPRQPGITDRKMR